MPPPSLSPHWGRIVHLAADTIRVPLPSLSLQGGAEEGLSPPLLSICNISTFFYPISSIFWVNLKKNLFFLIKSRNFAVGLLLCSMLPRAFVRPATRPMGGKSMCKSCYDKRVPISIENLKKAVDTCKSV